MRATDQGSMMGRRVFLGSAASLWLTGCAGNKNATELATRLGPAPPGVRLDPPPPEGVFWLRIAAARVPDRDAGGRPWNEADLPDPMAVLRIDGKKTLETEAIADSLAPVWQEGASGNFEIDDSSRLEIDLRDSATITARPIGHGRVPTPTRGDLAKGSLRVDIGKVGSKGNVTIAVEEAHALFGLGFDYEIFDTQVVVSRVLRHSPAAKAGMRVKDEIISVDGRRFTAMSQREIRGVFRVIEAKPVEFIVRHIGGTTENFPLGEGACYPLFEEYGPIA